MTTKGIFQIILLGAVAVSQGSCSNSKSQEIDVSFVPNRPLVIKGDIKIDDFTTADPSDTLTIAAPWFRTAVNVTNNSDTQVTIVSIIATVTDTRNEKKEYTTKLPEDAYYIATVLPGATMSPSTWFFDSLPADTYNGLAGLNLRYSIRATLIGWFGTPDEPTERFEKTISFSAN